MNHYILIILLQNLMYKSSTTAKAEYGKVIKPHKQKQASLFLPHSRNLFENNNPPSDEISDLQNRSTIHDLKLKVKSSLINFLKENYKMNVINEELLMVLDEINDANTLSKLFEKVFTIIKRISDQENRYYADEKEVMMAVRTKESAKLRILREDDHHKKKGKTMKHVEQLQKENQEVKKQLYSLKEEKMHLEKRMMGIIEQFKVRKSFYIAEIKKLTQIINSNPLDIRKLVQEKTRQAKILQQRLQKTQNQRISLVNNQISSTTPHINVFEPKSYQRNAITSKKGDLFSNRSEYNTEIRPLKNITSIQRLQEEKDG